MEGVYLAAIDWERRQAAVRLAQSRPNTGVTVHAPRALRPTPRTTSQPRPPSLITSAPSGLRATRAWTKTDQAGTSEEVGTY